MKLLKSMYVMTNSGKMFADDLTEWLIEEGFVQSQCQMSIYYKYAPYLEAGTRRSGVEELTMILPPWSIERERVGSLLMWF